jgi:enoyl-CoA hydratase/carnithine racemase
MLAGCCDFRFMRADRGYMCLPEIDTGIQIAPSMLEWMSTIIPDHLFKRMLLSGDRIGAVELEKNNVIIKACESAEKTLEEAIAFAKTFQKSRKNMREMKIRAYKHIIDKMEKEDPEYFDYKPERVKQGQLPIFMATP